MENNKFINKTENKNNSKEKNENYLLPQIVEIKGRNINKDNENQLQLLINNQEKKGIVSTFITGTDIINDNSEIDKMIKLKSESQKILKTSNDNTKEKLGQYYFPIIMRNMRREYSSLANILKNRPIDLSRKINFYKNKGLFKGPVNLGRETKEKSLSPLNDLMNYINDSTHFYNSNHSLNMPNNSFRENNKRIIFSPVKINNDKRYYQKKYFYDKFINSQENQLNARQIVMTKLPQIKQYYGLHYSNDNIIPKERVKNYNIIKPY